MVHDQSHVITGPTSPDQIAVVFDEQRLVSDAGFLLTASLAARFWIAQLVNDTCPSGPGCRVRRWRGAG